MVSVKLLRRLGIWHRQQAVIPGETWEQFLDDILRICDVPPELYEKYRAKNRLAAEQKISSGRFTQRVSKQYWDVQAEQGRKNSITMRKKTKEIQGSLESLSNEDGQQVSTDKPFDGQKQETLRIVLAKDEEQQDSADDQPDDQGSVDNNKSYPNKIMNNAVHMLDVLGRIKTTPWAGGTSPGIFMNLKPIRVLL